jgi:hypothetical protein
MIRLTIIANGHRLVRDLTPEQTLHAAKVLRAYQSELERCALIVLAEGRDRVTHIICNRPALRS